MEGSNAAKTDAAPEAARRTYAVSCLYGLEGALAVEVRDRLGPESERHWCEVVFPFGGDPARLLDLRIAGNAFLLFDAFPIGHTLPSLNELARRVASLPIEQWEETCRRMGVEPDGDISIRVSRKGEHNYSYAEVQEVALHALAAATGRKATLDPRPLELRIGIHEDSCRLLGRLTPKPLGERTYRRYRTPAQTDPTLAAAMVRFSNPTDGGLFLDPFCGAGTIPIERALAGPAGRIVAGEMHAKRVGWAAANARRAGADVSFARWDARRLPFHSSTFDRIVTSPPQSDPLDGRPWDVPDFASLLQESLRVLKYGGQMVWLVQRRQLFERALKQLGVGGRLRATQCSWKGKTWTICTVDKPL